jgi:hypothetical protein
MEEALSMLPGVENPEPILLVPTRSNTSAPVSSS